MWFNKHPATFRNLRKPVLTILKLTNEKLSPILSPSKGDYPAYKNLFKVTKITLGCKSQKNTILIEDFFVDKLVYDLNKG